MQTKALFPGSFDPFTAGHYNILCRALSMFDSVTVAVGLNQDKRGFFTNEQRIDIINQSVASLMDRVNVIDYDGLTVDICRQLGIHHIVRGVRNMLDFENERSIAKSKKDGNTLFRNSALYDDFPLPYSLFHSSFYLCFTCPDRGK